MNPEALAQPKFPFFKCVRYKYRDETASSLPKGRFFFERSSLNAGEPALYNLKDSFFEIFSHWIPKGKVDEVMDLVN
ncbi:MAG: hypothetical protein A2Y28_02700 [Chlamydiae bacterium GWC2_50_10]|nr:MAG: hypothetical protein A2Y28_02700 [Chlamydiae bacterium GWC2_50_10]